MSMRKVPLVVNKVYHVFNKSIAGSIIFNDRREFTRMLNAIRYYQREKPDISFNRFNRHKKIAEDQSKDFTPVQHKNKLIEIIAYCLMPTHFHLILKQLAERGTSIFMSNVQNSYARYFNTKYKRKGPLWEGKFKNVLIAGEEQLLHVTRYLHLNPVTAQLVEKPEQWPMSSYREYLFKTENGNKICKYDDVLNIESNSYRSFVEGQILYQKELAKIKDMLCDE